MKNLNRFILLFSICFFRFTIFSHSQSPHSFNYQLIARDTSGLVLSNRTIGIKISILQDAPGGAVVYGERHSATTNNYGLVNLSIGTGNVISGDFSLITWGNNLHFLKLELDPTGGTSYFTMGTIQLVSVPYSLYAEKAGSMADTNLASKWTQTGNDIYNNNSGNVGIGINAPDGKLIVKGDSLALASEPLFEVKNKDGDPVFVVYPDSVRIIISQSASKATAQGGFAVSGRSSSKGATGDYLVITPDSARIYLEESSNKATALGGFAVSGRSSSKGTSTDYLNVSVDTTETIYPGEPRILWYPTKEAFLTGKVLIESKDSVGKNSFASGFESKSVGDWSQALGFQAIARGDYSTAIGKNAVANFENSFAFGDGAKALNQDAYAFGAFTEARGIGSFAFGYVGRDSLGPTGAVTKATGNYSFAFGLGSQALAEGAIALGTDNLATGPFSLSMGYKTKATYWYSTALGTSTTASGDYSTALGNNTTASGGGSTAMGDQTTASGGYTTAMGFLTVANQYCATAMGSRTKASGQFSTAMGYHTIASGYASTSIGDETVASGYDALAMGRYSTAEGRYTTAMGFQTKAKPYAALVIGQYNDTTCNSQNWWDPSDPVLIIGNGSSDVSRSNAMTVLKNGNVGIGVTAPLSMLEVNGAIATTIKKVTGTTTLDNTAEVWYLSGTASTFTLPAASTCQNRRYILVARGVAITTSIAYTTLAGTSSTTVTANTSVEIISDGTNWLQIK